MVNFLKRLAASEVIEIWEGRATVAKGKLSGTILSDVSDVARQYEIKTAQIWIKAGGSISFSRSVPEQAHQRFRNVLASR